LKNNKLVAGVDEVGRGCLAGPVVSAVVILKKTAILENIKDSKKLSFNLRLKIADHIKKHSFYSIGTASVEEIYKINILQASLLSMKRALDKMSKKPKLVLIDGIFAPKGIKNFKVIIKGDMKFKCIAAASIIAKVYRDNLMIKLSKKFKNYHWNKNFGYGTREHLQGIKKYGVTKHHRKGFSPIHKMLFR